MIWRASVAGSAKKGEWSVSMLLTCVMPARRCIMRW
jgi:hypothetical protein